MSIKLNRMSASILLGFILVLFACKNEESKETLKSKKNTQNTQKEEKIAIQQDKRQQNLDTIQLTCSDCGNITEHSFPFSGKLDKTSPKHKIGEQINASEVLLIADNRALYAEIDSLKLRLKNELKTFLNEVNNEELKFRIEKALNQISSVKLHENIENQFIKNELNTEIWNLNRNIVNKEKEIFKYFIFSSEISVIHYYSKNSQFKKNHKILGTCNKKKHVFKTNSLQVNRIKNSYILVNNSKIPCSLLQSNRTIKLLLSHQEIEKYAKNGKLYVQIEL